MKPVHTRLDKNQLLNASSRGSTDLRGRDQIRLLLGHIDRDSHLLGDLSKTFNKKLLGIHRTKGSTMAEMLSKS